MKPLEFIFAFLEKFIKFPAGRLSRLRDEAANWETEQKSSDGKLSKLLSKSELWYVQVGVAIFFLVAIKWFSNWMMSKSEPDVLDDDDDEFDEEGEAPKTGFQRFNLGVD